MIVPYGDPGCLLMSGDEAYVGAVLVIPLTIIFDGGKFAPEDRTTDARPDPSESDELCRRLAECMASPVTQSLVHLLFSAKRWKAKKSEIRT